VNENAFHEMFVSKKYEAKQWLKIVLWHRMLSWWAKDTYKECDISGNTDW